MTIADSTPRIGDRSYQSRLDEAGVLDQRYVLVHADNATLDLVGETGAPHRCIDFMSAFAAVNFGHRNPAIERALTRSSDLTGLFHGPDADRVAQWLCARLPDPPGRRVLYQVGGSFAVAAALALARRARPGRVMSIEGGFHGLGVDAAALTSVQRRFSLHDTGFADLLAPEVVHLTPGVVPRAWDGISCLIYEPVQGANGYVPLDREWLGEVTSSAASAGVITIADEIQCGFFRHGEFSPATAWGLDPDIVLYSKSLTNGMYPLSAVVYRRFLEAGADPVYLAHTFQTGTLGTAAAYEVTRYIDDNDVAGMGAAVGTRLAELADRLRTAGLARAVHAIGPSLSFEPTAVASRDLVRQAFTDGVLVFSGGRHGERIRVAPPLTIPDAQLLAGIERVWSAAGGRAGP
ncbi:aminotransferase class III-fold pyridoxal phosphate-dependent enzyme [Frankia sp. AgB32]|uniref:aminotransferase class III-fold pyridoxal phosphate-dependent enzyme n=1 Tax=Frankia sp. AgB32 TaxID=631119 RepID=UPI00200F4736|nr:aminotransferase class III-fold pyridoxal phosphate-dependent enzyme [Frankia sp. AgB32]MCK9896093.1 aminotransferase class III-fold pyridoxal phosphate-dependent enzyme [Frankia sp. AgB32]